MPHKRGNKRDRSYPAELRRRQTAAYRAASEYLATGMVPQWYRQIGTMEDIRHASYLINQGIPPPEPLSQSVSHRAELSAGFGAKGGAGARGGENRPGTSTARDSDEDGYESEMDEYYRQRWGDDVDQFETGMDILFTPSGSAPPFQYDHGNWNNPPPPGAEPVVTGAAAEPVATAVEESK